MSLFKDVYYVIVCDGTPVEVTQDWGGAQMSVSQYKTRNRRAHIVPTVPMPSDHPDFLDEEPTKPQQLEFDLSDVEIGPGERNPEVC